MLIVYGAFILLDMQVLAQVWAVFIVISLVGITMQMQTDIKKWLESTGSKNYLKELITKLKNKKDNLLFQSETMDAVVEACSEMQSTKTGALIVFEVDTPLDSIQRTGQKLDAKVQKALLLQIFVKNTPLHDGALTIKNDRIDSATCYLPLSTNQKISKNLGTRHRAAIGVTEQISCFVVTVQEETGAISLVIDGKIKHNISKDKLRAELEILRGQRKTQLSKEQSKEKRVISIKRKSQAIVLQLLCQIAVWMATINLINPITTERIQDLGVETLNAQLLEQSDKTFDIVSGKQVQVILKGRRKALDSLSKQDIRAVADFKNLTPTNQIPIEVSLKDSGISVEYIQNPSMYIELDDIAEITLTPTYKKIGESADKTFVSNITQSTDQIKISGPSKLIKTLDKIEFSIDINGKQQQFSTTAEPVIYDKNGNTVQLGRLELSIQQIDLDIEILNTKEVDLNIDLVNKNPDIKILSYEPAKTTVQLAGSQEDLDSIDNLNITVDITGDLENANQQKIVEAIDLQEYLEKQSEDLTVYGETKLSVQVDLERKQSIEFVIDSQEITAYNTPKNMQASISGQYTIEFRGFSDDLDKISLDSLEPKINLKGLRDGEHSIELEVNQPDGVEIKSLPIISVQLSR